MILANRDQALEKILQEEYDADPSSLSVVPRRVALQAMRRAYSLGESKEVLGRFVEEPALTGLEEGAGAIDRLRDQFRRGLIGNRCTSPDGTMVHDSTEKIVTLAVYFARSLQAQAASERSP